ncbi:hypothetical protein Tco_0607814, partial [Tanacetum coccineum]
KDVEIKSSSSSTLTSPEASELEDYLEKDSIPPGIDLTLPPTFKVSSSNPTSPTLTGEKVCSWKTSMFFSLVQFVWKMMTRIAIRKKIICLLATYLHKQPKLLSHPQEVEEINEKEDEVSRDIPIHTIVMPIRITFDNPIDFNDHFSKPKDLKKDLTISFDSTTISISPPPLLDSDSPFTAELSANVTFSETRTKTLLVFKKPSFLLPPPEPPDECLKKAVLKFYQNQKTFPLNVKDVNSFTHFTYSEDSPLIFSFQSENFVFDPGLNQQFLKPLVNGYIKNHKKTVKNRQARTRESEEYKAKARKVKPQSKSAKKSQSQSKMVKLSQTQKDKSSKYFTLVPQKSKNVPSSLIGPKKA